MKTILKTARVENGINVSLQMQENGAISLLIEGETDHCLSLFESVTISFRFQAFTLKRFIPSSNHTIFKIVFILVRLRKLFSVNRRPKRHDFVRFSFENGIV